MHLPPTYGFVYWLLLDQKSREQVEVWMSKLGKEAESPKFRPHLTVIKAPDSSGEDQIISNAKALAGRENPIQLPVQGIGFEEFAYRAFYLKVEPVAPLLSLREKLAETDSDRPESYNPHISLLYGSFPDRLKDRLKKNLSIPKGTVFTADRLAVIKLDGTPNHWTVKHVSKL